jgi:SAM-dependent methyltransferase
VGRRQAWGAEDDLAAGDARHAVAGHYDRFDGKEPVSMFDEEFWDERYRSNPAVWSGRPNPQLVAEAVGLTPGTALDVGSGEGADAIWLASRGWQVTAVDFSATALRRGAAHAETLGAGVAGRIHWLHADLTVWEPAQEHFDLVSAQFMHLPAAPRQELFARLAAAVAPGGTLLLVGHHPEDMRTTMPRPGMSDLFFTAEEVARSLDPGRWNVLAADARPRPATDPEGREIIIHDTVLRAAKNG